VYDAIHTGATLDSAERSVEFDDFMAGEQITDSRRCIERFREADISGVRQ
jgi:hypothetical protein